MIVKNHELVGFINFLMDLNLIGKQSRMRTRFCKALIEKQQRFNEEYELLINESVEKDENGLPIKVEQEDGQLGLKLKDPSLFASERDELFNESNVFTPTEDTEEMFNVVRDVVLNTDKMFSGKEAIEYDRYCEIVES
ncbi:hypothetical protein M5X17_27475 [Paenibacillus alvei]|uniref:hypothetical protein n=1 Tax=Paenibacillus alvei TaxID=44250 RepID=UPI002281DC3F|nr:hypothetical protein [Paenibacillus alvei]MCY9737446.1 hypothetical protein [Paenibacillus alvei]